MWICLLEKKINNNTVVEKPIIAFAQRIIILFYFQETDPNETSNSFCTIHAWKQAHDLTHTCTYVTIRSNWIQFAPWIELPLFPSHITTGICKSNYTTNQSSNRIQIEWNDITLNEIHRCYSFLPYTQPTHLKSIPLQILLNQKAETKIFLVVVVYCTTARWRTVWPLRDPDCIDI